MMVYYWVEIIWIFRLNTAKSNTGDVKIYHLSLTSLLITPILLSKVLAIWANQVTKEVGGVEWNPDKFHNFLKKIAKVPNSATRHSETSGALLPDLLYQSKMPWRTRVRMLLVSYINSHRLCKAKTSKLMSKWPKYWKIQQIHNQVIQQQKHLEMEKDISGYGM